MKILDVECYPNYFLLLVRDYAKRKTFKFEIRNDQANRDRKDIARVMHDGCSVGFNSRAYDLPMIMAALAGYRNQELKKLSDKLVNSNAPWWEITNALNLRQPRDWDHVDIFDVAPGVQISLKLYGGRMHCRRLQDLPYDEATVLTEDQMDNVLRYCGNDLDTTDELLGAVADSLQLREKMGDEYGVDMRSKSDAQVAEAVFRVMLEAEGIDPRKVSVKPGTAYRYPMPDWIKFKTKALKDLQRVIKDAEFVVGSNGRITLPDDVSVKVNVNRRPYQVGIGGLHSCESAQSVVPGEDEVLFDADFASFYPYIIINEGLYPKHLTTRFTRIYEGILKTRLDAKRSGDKVTDAALKIALNGSYGKFGNHYSFLYSPELLIRTTLTGQLSLLMLIEMTTKAGANVVSANTDGIVILCKKADLEAVRDAMLEFEMLSGFELEETHYKALYSRDVNNYVAVKTDGSTKGKGIFTPAGLMKNPAGEICYQAVKAFLATGKPISETIYECDDIRAFCHVRTVRGGAIWSDGDQYLGKTVRWYYAVNCNTVIRYKKSGNKVPMTDGAMPIMELPDKLPVDVDYDHYIRQAFKLLEEIGYYNA